MQVEEQIRDAGAQLIWVLEQTTTSQPADAQFCRDFMDDLGSDVGLCVGDGQTSPTASAFDNSPFSVGMGFDIIVGRETMRIEFSTSSGIGGGNENINGAALLAEVEAVVAGLNP